MATKAKVKPVPLKKAGKSTDRPGNGGARPNSGRKSKAAMLGLIALLDANWPADARARSVQRLSELAAEGNIDAIKLLYSYAFGKPKETKEVGGIDGQPIKHDVYLHRYDKQIDPE